MTRVALGSCDVTTLAQLVKHTGSAEVMDLNPVHAAFFQVIFSQLLKLCI